MAHKILSVPVSIEFKTFPCRWQVNKPEAFTYKCASQENAVYLDAYEVREEFLRVSTTDTDEVLAFLNKTGLFVNLPRVKITNFHEWQAEVRLMMMHQPTKWKAHVSEVFLNR